jgi:hypothetical protein
MRYVTLGLCALSIVASAQENPLTWFPLRVGSRWIYEHEWKSGDRNQPAIDRWSTEETVTGWATFPEGIVVLREAKERVNLNGKPVTPRILAPDGSVRQVTHRDASHRGGYLVARSGYPYLIRGNCVYVISEGWDPQKQDLRPEFRKYLSDGSVSPDFCFPLQNGREWGTADIPWRVEPAREGLGAFLPTQYSQAVHIFSNHFGSGGWDDVWFQEGIGVVGEHYLHNGSYDEYTKKLVSFTR